MDDVHVRPGAYEQLDAVAEQDAGGPLERCDDLVGGIRPDHATGMGYRLTVGTALGKFEVNVAAVEPPRLSRRPVGVSQAAMA